MGDEARWQGDNEEHLAAALAWLRLRLTWMIEQREPSLDSSGRVTADEIGRAAAAVTAAEAAEPAPALATLSRLLGLSRLEEETLLLCVAMELDTRVGQLCALAQGEPNRPYPTFALALRLFDRPAWELLSPERPLRFWRLVEINQPGAQPLTTSPLRADERVVNYVKGLNYLDDRLTPFVTLASAAEGGEALPPSQRSVVEAVANRLRGIAVERALPVIQLLGVDGASKREVARQAAASLGLHLSHLPVELLPRQTADLETLARLWQRESLLLPLALYLDAHDVDETAADDGPASPLSRFLARTSGPVFLDVRDIRPGLGRATVAFDVAKPTPGEQQVAWREVLSPAMPDAPALLAGQFNLSVAAIHQIARAVRREAPEQEDGDTLWQTCLVYTRPRLDTLAQRLTPKATWEDIVLPEDRVALLRQIANQVQWRGKVYEEWRFRERMNRGLGIVALFAGESGTGKTMAAEVLANELKLNLYRIDLSAVVSKYIGETEKNLRRLFDAAEDGGAILFFDEADALFGKRSQVRDSHDRYANIEINYLLQRLEAYQGLAVLATNMKGGLDEAFIRRLRFIVNFPMPEAADRERMWQRVFPPEMPLDQLDYGFLAHYKLAGGSIYNAALNAAFLAAQAGTPLTMALVLQAIRTEFLKSDRLINEADFVWPENGGAGW